LQRESAWRRLAFDDRMEFALELLARSWHNASKVSGMARGEQGRAFGLMTVSFVELFNNLFLAGSLDTAGAAALKHPRSLPREVLAGTAPITPLPNTRGPEGPAAGQAPLVPIRVWGRTGTLQGPPNHLFLNTSGGATDPEGRYNRPTPGSRSCYRLCQLSTVASATGGPARPTGRPDGERGPTEGHRRSVAGATGLRPQGLLDLLQAPLLGPRQAPQAPTAEQRKAARAEFSATGKSWSPDAGATPYHEGTSTSVRPVQESRGTVAWQANAPALANAPARAHVDLRTVSRFP
jgi:hypothetical protein